VRIAVLGAGRIGGNAARLFARAGHEVLISFSREPDALPARAAELGEHVMAASESHAVAVADVVMLSVPWDEVDEVLRRAGSLVGKVVIDTTNPYGKTAKPAAGQTVAQFNSARMPGARYVRAFNTLTSGFQAEAAERAPGERAVLFLCGDFPEAKQLVAGLIGDAGFEPMDLGSTVDSAAIDPPRRPGAIYGEEFRLEEARAFMGRDQ
jgi:8-hydroxy-5-deazaflavin:NADPH oxidoreductase